jgi:hypothetical protein
MQETVRGAEESCREKCKEEYAGEKCGRKKTAREGGARTVNCRCEVDSLAVRAEVGKRGVHEVSRIDAPGVPLRQKLKGVYQPVVYTSDAASYIAGGFEVAFTVEYFCKPAERPADPPEEKGESQENESPEEDRPPPHAEIDDLFTDEREEDRSQEQRTGECGTVNNGSSVLLPAHRRKASVDFVI